MLGRTRRRTLVGLAVVIALFAGLSGCTFRDGRIAFGDDSPPGTLNFGDSTDVKAAVLARCKGGPNAPETTFEGVFAEEWDRITFANASVTLGELAAEANAPFDERKLDRRPTYYAIVLQRGGEAVAAYQSETMPFDVEGERGMVSMDSPGSFRRRGDLCLIGP